MDIPTEELANLRTISLYKLQTNCSSEQELLLETCIEDGFFYLDLTHPRYSSLLENIDVTSRLSESLFSYPSEIKNLFDVDKVSDLKINGYKPKGRNIVTRDGKRHGFESWVLPRNGLLQLSSDPFPYPPLIASNLGLLRGAVNGLGDAAQAIFTSLSKSLALPEDQRLEGFHRPACPSPDILRLIKLHDDADPSSQPHIAHTDMGSLTFVFSRKPGLQLLPRSVSEKEVWGQGKDASSFPWRYVMPRPDHAVVNIGDCLSLMTNGLLKSTLHRVGPVKGHPMDERYSLAYLMRPENHTILRPLTSPKIMPSSIRSSSSHGEEEEEQQEITSGEWIRRKFKAIRAQHDSINNTFDKVMTGGRGVLD